MATTEKVSRRKLSLLDLEGELFNVSRACKIMGYSRQLLHKIHRNYQTYGAAVTFLKKRKLALKGIRVSSGGVLGVWTRYILRAPTPRQKHERQDTFIGFHRRIARER